VLDPLLLMMDTLDQDQEVPLSVGLLATTTIQGVQEAHPLAGTHILQPLAATCILEAGVELILADQVTLQVPDLKDLKGDHQPPVRLVPLHHPHTNHTRRAVLDQAMDLPSLLLVLQVVQVQVVLLQGQFHHLVLQDRPCRHQDHDQ